MSTQFFRRTISTLLSLGIVAFGMIAFELGFSTFAGNSAFGQTKGASGLPIPRFVSLKSQRVNMRVGPGRDYKVQWLYVRKGLPVEIIQEFDNWRKVRDPSGQEGWILHSLLAGKRTAIVAPWEIKAGAKKFSTQLFDAPSTAARTIAKVEAGVVLEVEQCEKDLCQVTLKRSDGDTFEGYIAQGAIWGVYPGENYNAN